METNVTRRVSRASFRYWPFLLSSLMLCLLASFQGSAQNILTEGFEGTTFPPTGWTRANVAGSSTVTWQACTGSCGTPGNGAARSGTRSAWFNCYGSPLGNQVELRSPAMNFTGTSLVRVSFWYYKNTYVYSSSPPNNDYVEVYANTSATSVGGSLIGSLFNFYQKAPVTAGAGWYKYSFSVPVSFNGPTNYIIFKAITYYGPDFYIDDISIDNVLPCAGPVAPGTMSPSGTQTVCPGTQLNLTTAGYTPAGATFNNWQYSLNNGPWVNAVGPGSNTDSWTTFPLLTNTRFRWYQYCTNTGDSTFTNILTVNVTGGGSFPVYASLPFSESFESWTNGCSTTDLPSNNWTNIPATGNNSFRREDQGASASWTSPATGPLNPAFKVGAHSARLHTYYAATQANQGTLSCYVDCSAPGNKELEFYLINSSVGTYLDSCYVEYSTDGGMSWSLLARYGPGSGNWDYKNLILPSNSATTVVRWRMWQGYAYTGYADMGLDGVRILPPCSAKPTAGKIDSVEACAGKNFQLSTTGTSASAGLTYQWQFKPTGSTLPWSNLAGGNIAKPTANITVPTSFRVIVGCGNLTPVPTDTSAVFDVKLSAFYYCYCNYPASVQYPQYNYTAIGNMSIYKMPSMVQIMNNSSTATPPYVSFTRSVPAPVLIRDSTYRFEMLAIAGTYSYTTSNANFFLDWNRNGIWDVNSGERIMTKSTGSSAPNIVFQNYTIPTNAGSGLTGLRAITGYNITPPTDPCGSFYYMGECEDYLVYIEYQPCSGPVNAGTAYVSDTAVCPGYTVDLWDTAYEKQRTGILRMWEVSTDGGFSYSAIPGSANQDTMFNVVVTASSYGLKYRLRVICSNTGDTTYSNSVSVVNPPALSCYPFASALPPGTADSSDIGTFEIASYINPQPMKVSGPHLGNPLANRRRTDYTAVGPMVLAADSSYRLAIYHTMRTMKHADALISVFIDFNHDGLYTVTSPGYPFPPEMIFQGKTNVNDFYLDTVFKMPSTLIGGVPTGLRVVLNNDVNPANSGNNGVGGFTSGEVEDYVVTLTRNNLGVNPSVLIQNMAMYPNPTESKSTVVFDAPKAIAHLELVVTTLAGQQVMTKSFENIGSKFSTELDMSGYAKGVYFVELRADGEKISRKLTVR